MHQPSLLQPSPTTTARPAPDTLRPCRWCDGPLPAGQRSDTRYCSKRCRQAHWRFARGRQTREPSTGSPRRFAYADPPYPGKASIYRDHPDYAGEVDHRQLLEVLHDGYPDGWALSTSAAALPDVLALAPDGTQVAAWFRGERPTTSYRPLSAWEPVLYHGGRPYLPASIEDRRLDALVHHARPRTTDPYRVVGAKPAAFAWWLFDLLGALPGDTLDDLYPGSGGIARAWDLYQESRTTGETRPVDSSSSATRHVVAAGGDD